MSNGIFYAVLAVQLLNLVIVIYHEWCLRQQIGFIQSLYEWKLEELNRTKPVQKD